MPSFRITITVGSLRTGVRPQRVLPTAAAAAAELTTVEASSLDVVSGTPRITVRFTAETIEEAQDIATIVVQRTATVAQPVTSRLTQRVKGRWPTVV